MRWEAEKKEVLTTTIYTDHKNRNEEASRERRRIVLNTETSQLQQRSSHLKGLRTVATIEIAKGFLAILAGVWLLSFREKDIGDLIANLLDQLHIDPAHEFAIRLVSLADKITPEKVELAAAIALFYALIRFVEGYGLWNARTWAEYFAMISGAAYLPFEVWEFIRRPSWLHAAIILINVGVVLYIVYVRVAMRRERRLPPAQAG